MLVVRDLTLAPSLEGRGIGTDPELPHAAAAMRKPIFGK